MTVEITPGTRAPLIAQQLLAVAEADERFTVNDVKTSSSGPLGFAFLVPIPLHEAWLEAFPPVNAEADGNGNGNAEPKRRGRPRKTETPEE